jgi:hypothetical protein
MEFRRNFKNYSQTTLLVSRGMEEVCKSADPHGFKIFCGARSLSEGTQICLSILLHLSVFDIDSGCDLKKIIL